MAFHFESPNPNRIRSLSTSPRVGICVRVPRQLSQTELKLGGDGEDAQNHPFLATAVLLTAILSTWPLLSFFRDTNSPTDGFDIDMFIALKGMLDGGIGGESVTFDNAEAVIELPALSPAERLVGAIFGPPE
eukprot:scaffold8535_cov132-Cylindrotheca_fusiformis.AAC.14